MTFKQALYAILLLVCCTSSSNVYAGATSGYLTYADVGGKPYTVEYDHRAIKIDGVRTMLLAGVVHYPRSTPGMWDYIFKMARAEGLNTIQTYVFWNYHEHTRGVYDFEERGNLSLFLEMAAANGLFVNLRIGPYVCAEWTNGGLPVWLNEVPGMSFRSYNMPWLEEMYRFTADVIDYVRPYLASNGGPIILSQIENEYNDDDMKYVEWCGQVVSELQTSIPWMMCNGHSANNTINTCNSCNCFEGGWMRDHVAQFPAQPLMYTENEGWFQQWGVAKALRSSEDLAYSVAGWIAAGGSYHAYYMWHGGNNYGLTAASGITTMYADDTPLASDGTPNEPKFSHLGELHFLAAKYAPVLLAQDVPVPLDLQSFQNGLWNATGKQVAYVYQGGQGGDGVTFLINLDEHAVLTNWANVNFTLSPYSVVIATRSLQVIYNSSHISASINVNNTKIVPVVKELSFSSWSEPLGESVPVVDGIIIPTTASSTPLEQLGATNDDTAYLWYRANFTAPAPADTVNITVATRMANALLFFVNGRFVGEWDDHTHQQGNTTGWVTVAGEAAAGGGLLEILSVTLGIDNGVGAGNFEQKGIVGAVQVGGRAVEGEWVHQKGLIGQFFKIYTQKGHRAAKWTTPPVVNQQVTWYTASFALPGNIPDSRANPLLLDVTGMGRGHAYMNGNDLGLYWTIAGTCEGGVPCCCQQSQVNCDGMTQQYYHIPPDWVHQNGEENVLTFFDDLGATNPAQVRIVQRIVDGRYV